MIPVREGNHVSSALPSTPSLSASPSKPDTVHLHESHQMSTLTTWWDSVANRKIRTNSSPFSELPSRGHTSRCGKMEWGAILHATSVFYAQDFTPELKSKSEVFGYLVVVHPIESTLRELAQQQSQTTRTPGDLLNYLRSSQPTCGWSSSSTSSSACSAPSSSGANASNPSFPSSFSSPSSPSSSASPSPASPSSPFSPF